MILLFLLNCIQFVYIFLFIYHLYLYVLIIRLRLLDWTGRRKKKISFCANIYDPFVSFNICIQFVYIFLFIYIYSSIPVVCIAIIRLLRLLDWTGRTKKKISFCANAVLLLVCCFFCQHSLYTGIYLLRNVQSLICVVSPH